MSVLKVIEIMASSPKSWEDATIIAVTTAGETLKGIRSVYIHHMNEGWNNRNKPPKVDKTGPETSCSYSVLKGKEEIATTEKIGTPTKIHNNNFFIIKEI